MFTHIGMLTLVDDVTAEQRERVLTGLRGLQGVVPGLRGAEVEPDAGIRDGNADVFFRMTFDDRAAWEAYGSHPAHVAVLRDVIAPVLAAKCFIQVAAPAAGDAGRPR